MEKQCSTCGFWQDASKSLGTDTGQCRRYAHRTIIASYGIGGRTDNTGWCGEWEAKK